MHDFNLIEQQACPDVKGQAYIYEHKGTGAKLLHVDCPDDNKVFMVSFRTLPENSNGIAHILEHSVLCGSDRFPVKEPFVDLMRGSLNTFLNAMTYDDRTVYPVSSRHQKDFENLFEVYFDAVFHPLIYRDPLILKQEGWHYELDESGLSINGVVYNEMRGALSDPKDLLQSEAQKLLFEGGHFGLNSGGEPAEIISLDQETFERFHSRYYHPSNALFYFYGDLPIEKHLERLTELLKNYERAESFSHHKEAKVLSAPVHYELEVPAASEEDWRSLVFGYRTVSRRDEKEELLLSFLTSALCSLDVSPLKKALKEHPDLHIGDCYMYQTTSTEPLSTYLMFMGLDEASCQKLPKILPEILEKICEEGFDESYLQAIMNDMQFKLLEAEQGGIPRGIILGLKALNAWPDGTSPLEALQLRAQLEQLKKSVKSDVLCALIRKYFIENKQAVVAWTKPDPTLLQREIEKEALRLEGIRQQLSEAEIQKIYEDMEGLRRRREEPDSEEARQTMPRLTLEDMPEAPPKTNLEVDESGNSFLDAATSGIWYQTLEFAVQDIEDRFALTLLCEIFAELPTEAYDELSLKTQQMLVTGGISTHIESFDRELRLQVQTKWLPEHREAALALLEEVILRSRYTAHQVIQNKLRSLDALMENYFNSSGHVLTSRRVRATQNEASALSDACEGLAFFDQLNQELANTAIEDLSQRVEALAKRIFVKKRLTRHSVGEASRRAETEAALLALVQKLPEGEVAGEMAPVLAPIDQEGIQSTSDVQYVAQGGNFAKAGLPWDGRLLLAKKLVDQMFLWQTVRVAGGAYGAMSWLSRRGDMGFVSYRDPKLSETYEVYGYVPGFVAEVELGQEELTEFIIGTLSEFMPLQTPVQAASSELSLRRQGFSYEDRVKDWHAVLNSKVEDVHQMAPYFACIQEQNKRCTIGSAEVVSQNKEAFERIRPLRQRG